MSTASTPLLAADGLIKRYHELTAVAGATVRIVPGRSIGIAGESGSGKSTLMRLLLGLEPPDAGAVSFEGTGLKSLDGPGRERYRAAVQAVLQDPRSSLNPRHRVWQIATEPAWIAGGLSRHQRMELARDLLVQVGLPSAHADRRPHELSGGERQRVAITRALSSNPRVILLDEPVASLDASIRGSVLNLLMRIGEERGITYCVVSHDLGAIVQLTDYLYVMYRGHILEEGPTEQVIADPRHPYTQLLVRSESNPLYEPAVGDETTMAPAGACPYLGRCEFASDRCRSAPPVYPRDGRLIACYLAEAAGRASVAAQPQQA